MPNSAPPTKSNDARPLWIIAISTAAIAVCLLLLVVKRQFEEQSSRAIAQSGEVEPEPLPAVDPPKAAATSESKRQPVIVRTRPETNTIGATNIEVIARGAVAESIPVLVDRTAGGVLAPVATLSAITGKVTLKGTPPPEIQLPQAKNDPNCGKFHQEVPTTQHYIVGKEGELANVIVMLKGISGKSAGVKALAATIDQIGCVYTPSIVAVQTGQTLNVKNSDPVPHNIHVIPDGVSGNKEANPMQISGAPLIPMAFAKPEHFIKFKCDVHPWMFAWVTVVDHPYFAVTDKDGNFTIKDVPPGKYKIVAIHRKASPAPEGVEKDVEVKGGSVTVNYTLDAK